VPNKRWRGERGDNNCPGLGKSENNRPITKNYITEAHKKNKKQEVASTSFIRNKRVAAMSYAHFFFYKNVIDNRTSGWDVLKIVMAPA